MSGDKSMEEMAEIFAKHHAAPEITEEQFANAYKVACTPAETVTEKEAATRHMQEIVRVRNTLRFRENTLVSNLLGAPHARSKHPVEPWMWEQLKELIDEEKGNAIVRFLLKHGPVNMNELATQDFPQKDEEQFAMLIGYSVSGAGDLSYFSPAMTARADAEAERLIAERDAE